MPWEIASFVEGFLASTPPEGHQLMYPPVSSFMEV
jgi:hypothetical protein